MSTDETILKLKKDIEKKKNSLEIGKRFTPLTNCSLELDNIRYNLHTLDIQKLTYLIVVLNSYRLSAKDLGLEDFVVSGFSVNDWITDIEAKLAQLNRSETERKLKGMESRLTQLLSNEKKVELEVEEISKILME
jgi:hypothetical protein